MNGDIHNPFMVFVNPIDQAMKQDQKAAQRANSNSQSLAPFASKPPKGKVDEGNIPNGNNAAILKAFKSILGKDSFNVPQGAADIKNKSQPSSPFMPQDPLNQLPNPFYLPGFTPTPGKTPPDQQKMLDQNFNWKQTVEQQAPQPSLPSSGGQLLLTQRPV